MASFFLEHFSRLNVYSSQIPFSPFFKKKGREIFFKTLQKKNPWLDCLKRVNLLSTSHSSFGAIPQSGERFCWQNCIEKQSRFLCSNIKSVCFFKLIKKMRGFWAQTWVKYYWEKLKPFFHITLIFVTNKWNLSPWFPSI